MILMNDFKAESNELRSNMLSAVSRVLDSGWYVLGNELKSFEQKWANICGVAHGVGVGNGMDAIEIALRANKIGKGDEVITTSMTAFATVLAILRAGATPVLADIDPQTALLSLNSVKRCVNSKTKAILIVHLYGQLKEIDVWVNFCKLNNLVLIEDCAQAHLAKWQGKIAGSFGLAGAYSFYPTKNLGTVGDGGMLVTNDERIATLACQLRNYGQSKRYQHPELGLNSRLDEIHAAILLERVKWLEKFTKNRQKIADLYCKDIDNSSIRLLSLPDESTSHVYHLFVITSKNRDKLQAHLRTYNVQTLIHFPVPIHLQDSCRDIKCAPNGLIHSEQHANTCLSLPCHPHMKETDVNIVIDAVNNFK